MALWSALSDAEPGQTQFPADVAGRPGGLGGVGVADQPQPPVGHGPDIGPVGWAEGEERLVPGRSLLRCLVGGFGSDRVVGMVVAVGLAVGGDRGGLGFPVAAGGRVGGNRPERGDRPGGTGLGGVLAEAPFAVVHHGGDLGQVGLAVWIGQVGDAAGPGTLRLGQQRVDALADPGVDDTGDVPGTGQVLRGDGGAGDLGRDRARPVRLSAACETATGPGGTVPAGSRAGERP